MKTAFLGLGVMGYPMAGHLSAKGFDVVVFNRTARKAAAWVAQHKGARAASPAEAVDGADLVFTCLGDDPDVEDVLESALPSIGAGAVVVDHTTASPALARRFA